MPLTPTLDPDGGPKALAGSASAFKPSASFSPDGKRLLLAFGTSSAELRDAVTGSILLQFPHDQLVYHAAFSPDGRFVVTSSKDRRVRIWGGTPGKLTASPLQPQAPS